MTDIVAWALVLIGIGLAGSGVRQLRRADSWPGWAMVYLTTFRRVVVGACCVGAGVGLAENISWLLGVSVCVGVGELMESSYYISVMRWGQQRGTLST